MWRIIAHKMNFSFVVTKLLLWSNSPFSFVHLLTTTLAKVINQSSPSLLRHNLAKTCFFSSSSSLSLTLLTLIWLTNQVITEVNINTLTPLRLHPFHNFGFPGPRGRYTSLTNTMKKWVNKKRYKCNWKYFYRAPLGMWNRCHQLWRDRCVLILKLLILL